MKLLIKEGADRGLSAHIPDTRGRPLCKARLKLADWVVDERQRPSDVVCHSCLRVQATYEGCRMHIECASKSVANLVQGVLLNHGVRSRQQGSNSGDTTIIVMPIGAIDSETEPEIRQELNRISGAAIRD